MKIYECLTTRVTVFQVYSNAIVVASILLACTTNSAYSGSHSQHSLCLTICYIINFLVFVIWIQTHLVLVFCSFLWTVRMYVSVVCATFASCCASLYNKPIIINSLQNGRFWATYAASAWRGFTTADDRQRLEACSHSSRYPFRFLLSRSVYLMKITARWYIKNLIPIYRKFRHFRRRYDTIYRYRIFFFHSQDYRRME